MIDLPGESCRLPRPAPTHCPNGHAYPLDFAALHNGRVCPVCREARLARDHADAEARRARKRREWHVRQAARPTVPDHVSDVFLERGVRVLRPSRRRAVQVSTRPGELVMPEPDPNPPPRLLMAGPWQPPRYTKEGNLR